MKMTDCKHLCTFITLRDQKIMKFLCLVLNFQKIMKFLCLVLNVWPPTVYDINVIVNKVACTSVRAKYFSQNFSPP